MESGGKSSKSGGKRPTPGRPIQEGLFTSTQPPQLIASRCRDCGEITFPVQPSCPACTGRSSEEVLLSRRGTLWTWTIQHFPPPVPPYIGNADRKTFVPFGIGYIELPEGLRVESRLTVNDPERLEIGMPMELVVEKFGEDEQGNDLLTFAFQPAAE